MDFEVFADRALEIEETEADLAVVAAVADLLADADDDLETVTRFVQGRVFPAWDDRKLAVGPAMCKDALARAAGTNVDAADVEDRLADVGEIGAVAADLDLGGQQGLAAYGAGGSESLTVASVRTAFADIATASGAGSESARRDRLFGLFTRASPTEARFLARLVLEEMRIGVGEGTVRDAIASAFLPDDLTPEPPAWAIEDSATADDEDGVEPGQDEREAADDAADDAPQQVTLGDIASADATPPASADEAARSTDESGDSALSGDADDAPAVSDAADGDTASFDRPPAEAVAAVERALQVSNDYGRVAVVARDDGVEGLSSMHLAVGRPVQAMLAQAGTVTDTVEEWNGVAVETKYDGARVQIHHHPDGVRSSDGGSGPRTRLYSRNMEDVTAALPEIVEFVEATVDVPVILDGEVIAIDGDEILPFQRVLERFRRKHDVAKAREDVAVELRAFDCLSFDGTDLLDAPLRERREYLERALDGGMATYAVMYDPEKIDAFEEAVLEAGHEGIMLKDPDSTYNPGKRGQEWLKRKPDVETLDLVVTGAEWGEGRRANVFGTYEVAARNDGLAKNTDATYATIGHVATGITDAELAALTERMREHVVAEDGQTVSFEPAVVFEVGYEEIQRSPSTGSGFALRFPRLVAVREDKPPSDADGLERVERLFET